MVIQLNRKKKFSLKSFAASCAILYGTVLAIMFFAQRDLLYHPQTKILTPSEYGLTGFTEEKFESSDRIKLTAWFKAPEPGKPLFVYFHGNAGNISDRKNRLRIIADKGNGVFAFNYRGYGGSEGSPTEEGIYDDARAALKFLNRKGYSESEIIYLGESLGSGVAVQLATESAPKMLVLDSPYSSIAETAQIHYPYIPAKYIVMDRFESLAKIRSIKSPLLILHGELDNIVPASQGRKLFEAAEQPKKGIFYPGIGHVAVKAEVILQEIASFQMQLALRNTK